MQSSHSIFQDFLFLFAIQIFYLYFTILLSQGLNLNVGEEPYRVCCQIDHQYPGNTGAQDIGIADEPSNSGAHGGMLQEERLILNTNERMS